MLSTGGRCIRWRRRRGGGGGLLEFIPPAADFRLGTEMFCSCFVATLHPDPGQRGVDKEILRPDGVSALRGCERRVETTKREINFRERMPGFEGIWSGVGRATEFFQGGLGVAQSVVGRRIFDQRLEFVVGHERTKMRRPSKKERTALGAVLLRRPIEPRVLAAGR